MDTAKSFKLANGDPIVFTDFQKATEKFRQIEAESLDEPVDETTSFAKSKTITKEQTCANPKMKTPVKQPLGHSISELKDDDEEDEDIEWDDDDDQMNMSLRDIVQDNPAK